MKRRNRRLWKKGRLCHFTDHKKAIPACPMEIQRLWKMPDKTLKDSFKIKFKNSFKN